MSCIPEERQRDLENWYSDYQDCLESKDFSRAKIAVENLEELDKFERDRLFKEIDKKMHENS